MSTLRFDAVFFDSGGTLYSEEGINPNRSEVNAGRYFRFWQALKLFHLDADKDTVRELLLKLEMEKKAELGPAYTYVELAKATLKALELSLGTEEAVCLADAYAGPRYRTWLYQGTHELMEKLTAAGLYLGIIANTAWPGFCMDRAFNGVGLLTFFRTRIYSGDEKVEKPDVKIFRIAEQNAGLQGRGKRLLYVGNSAFHDVEAAHAAGWSAAFKCYKDKTSEGRADFDYNEPLELLDFILG